MSPELLSASTTIDWLKERLDRPELLEAHLQALLVADPRLAPVLARAGKVSLRTSDRGFAGMARIICGQQLSVASAAAIWSRVIALPGAADPGGFLKLDEPTLRAAGLSRGKVISMRATAEAALAGTLDFVAVEAMSAEEAIAHLTAIKGVGPWTAELYLLFCVGHPDIFPAGDLALKKAVADGLHLDTVPSTKGLIEIAQLWSPHRGAAALLFWRYFRVLTNREGVTA